MHQLCQLNICDLALYLSFIYRCLKSILSYKQLLFSFCIHIKRFLYPGEEISLYMKLSIGVQHIIYQHIQLSLDLFIMKKRRNIMVSSVSAWSRIIGFVLSTAFMYSVVIQCLILSVVQLLIWCIQFNVSFSSRTYLVIFSGSAQPIRKYVSWVYCWLV